MPHPVTWSRVFGTAVDLATLEQILRDCLHPPVPDVPNRASIALALDGKTLRGTIPHGHTQGVHLVAAYLPQEGVVLAQLEVAEKANEIVVTPSVLTQLGLAGTVVTGDAMYTQCPSVPRLSRQGAIICGWSRRISLNFGRTSNNSLLQS